MSNFSDPINVGYVCQIYQPDLPSKKKITVFEISFPRGPLPKVGGALYIFYGTPSKFSDPANDPVLLEVPVLLQVYKIFDGNIVRAFLILPSEPFIERIEGLPLGSEVIDLDEPVSDVLIRAKKKLSE